MVTALHCLSYVSAVLGLIFVLLSLGEYLSTFVILVSLELTLDHLENSERSLVQSVVDL